MECRTKKTCRPELDSIPEEALGIIFSFINNPRDRFTISLVCKKWYTIDSYTRKDVTVAFCYTTTPSSLTKRFTGLQSLKIKGKPRAAMFNLIPEDWGGYAGPWIREVAIGCHCLNSLHLRRMVVTDEDLMILAKERGHVLQVLRLDKCSGFSTIGLETIARTCRSLRILFLDESSIDEHDGNWLHELALHNSSLEVLNFFSTNLSKVDTADLEMLASSCTSLSSLKMNEMDLHSLKGVLQRAVSLKELGGVVISDEITDGSGHMMDIVSLPKGLTSLVGLMYMGDDNGDNYANILVQQVTSNLRKLDLQLAGLSVDGHCRLLRSCSNLETLEVLNDIGDEGLEVVANNCKFLRRLRIESGDREFQQGTVTQRGLISIARGCENLEYIALYMADINNAALMAVGEGCPKLKDFRLVLLADDIVNPDFPLDSGIYSLLRGCTGLSRLGLYLRPGSLSDIGMSYIGRYGGNIRWALLGLLGEKDRGLRALADGCPKLERLEMRDCVFTEAGIAECVVKMKALKYIWVQGYKATGEGCDLLAMTEKPCWNIEFIPERRSSFQVEEGDAEDIECCAPAQFLAYHSLAGRRMDCPKAAVCLVKPHTNFR